MKLSYVSLKKKFLTFRGRYILNPAIFRTLSNIYNGTFYKKWLLTHFLSLSPKIKKIHPKTNFPYFGKRNFLTLRLKRIIYFRKWNPALFSLSSKNKSNPPRENFLYFRKRKPQKCS